MPVTIVGDNTPTAGGVVYGDGTNYASTAAGTSGQVLTSQGSGAPTWAAVGISSVSSTVTSNTTLTSSSAGYQFVQMLSLGQSITLPNATTMSVGGPRFIIDNTQGGYPVAIRNSLGTFVMAISAGGIAQVFLRDASTSAGSWSVEGTGISPGFVSIDNLFSSTYLASTIYPLFAALDNSTSIHFLALSSGFAAVIVDNLGKVVGTPVTVTTTATNAICGVFKISSTQAVVFWRDNANNAYGNVLTVSGSSPTLSLAVGTVSSVGPSGSFTAETGTTSAPKLVQLASTSYLVSYMTGSTAYVAAISISGTTVTFGSATSIAAASNINSTVTYALTSTTGLVTYLTGASSPYTINAVVITVSGTTCTVGTPANNANWTTSDQVTSGTLLSPTKALIAFYRPGSTAATTAAITISGTTVTAGAVTTIESLSVNLGYTSDSATRYNPHLFALSSNTALLWYLGSTDGVSRVLVLTESGGSVTAGSILYNSISSANTSAQGNGAIGMQGTTEFLSAMQFGGSTNPAWDIVLSPHKISGTAITKGRNFKLQNKVITYSTSGGGLTIVRLSSGTYLILPYQAASMAVMTSNGDNIAYKGDVDMVVNILGGSYPYLCTVANNRIVFLCAGYDSASSSTLYNLHLLNVEVAT